MIMIMNSLLSSRRGVVAAFAVLPLCLGFSAYAVRAAETTSQGAASTTTQKKEPAPKVEKAPAAPKVQPKAQPNTFDLKSKKDVAPVPPAPSDSTKKKETGTATSPVAPKAGAGPSIPPAEDTSKKKS